MKTLEKEPAPTRGTSQRQDPLAKPTCILSIGAQRLPAAIVEERGGTLSVMIQGSPQFWTEESGRLTTPEAELSVRVFNIVRAEAEEGDPAGNIPAFRIGLERLGEVAREIETDESDEEIEARGRRSEARLPTSNLRPLLVMAAVVAVLVSAFATWRHFYGNRGQRSEVGGQRSEARLPISDLRPPTSDLWRLPGVEPFIQPEVAKKLELTPVQTGAYQRLNSTTQQAVEELEKYWGSAGRLELARRRTMLLDASRQEALQLLTDPQRKLWDEMAR